MAEPSVRTVEDPPRGLIGILRKIGPGMILAGSIVGSGELIATTRTGAEAGFTLLWLIIIGCMIKVFVQIEMGRYTIMSGRTTLDALRRVPGPEIEVHGWKRSARGNWITWFWLLMFLASIGQLGGIIGGVGQAMQISVPLTDSGRAYNAALDARVKLRVQQTEMTRLREGDAARPAADGQTLATLQAQIDALQVIVGKYEAQVAADAALQATRAELAKLEAAVDRAADSAFVTDLREQIADLQAARDQQERLVAEIGPPPRSYDDKIWAVIIAVITAFILVGGRYKFIEVFSLAMVASFTAITIGNLFALQGYDAWAVTWEELKSGLSFQLPQVTPEQRLAGARPMATALAAFGIIGVGASELMAYPYWCLEKGYARWTGPREDSEAWVGRARGWMRVMKWDAWCSMVLYTFATVAFYLLGAAVLHRTGLLPGGTELIRTLTAMYETPFGDFAPTIFLAGAFAVLYSTFFVANAANARLAADVIDAFGIQKLDAPRRLLWVRIFSFTFCITCAVIYIVFPNPVQLILLSGVMQALLLPMLGCAALWFRYRDTDSDPRLRPTIVFDVFLWLSFVGFLIVGAYLTYDKLFG